MGRLFGTDGIRGIANTELTCQLATSVGKAVATVLKRNSGDKLKILIGCDTRRSSDMLCAAIASGICSAGADVILVGCIATPAVAYLTVKYSADAGIVVSASHNPAEYNGIKIFSSDGIKLPDQLEEEIEALISDQKGFPSPTGTHIGMLTDRSSEGLHEYLSHLKSSIDHRLDGLNIAIDCANGAAYRTAPTLFTELGAKVHTLSASPDGDNINEKCGSTHLDSLIEYMKKNKLDAGIAFDGDADRCILVDSEGNEIDGDRIMAMCALDMKKQGKLKNNTVVGTVMTNLGFTKFCKENEINFLSTKVGDRFVLEEMLLGDLSLGGEQSGHIIFRDIITAGDGQLTALQVLSLMKRSGKTLAELASVMKVYPQVTVNIKANADEKLRFFTDPNIKALIKSSSDLLSANGRLLVRPSGTEPLIRIMAEGEALPFITEIVKNLANKLEIALKNSTNKQ